MEQKKSNISPKSGMSRDTHISLLKPTEYSFALNANTESEIGDKLNISNESSNYLSVQFTAGYKAIEFKKDLLNNKTYYFLTNPTTKKSSIGYVSDTITDVYNEDLYEECIDCRDGHNVVGTPLEQITQTPSHTYTEIINDICHAVGEGFNFDINFPILFIEMKQDKFGTFLYWNDYKNPPRWINVEDISYLFTQEVACDDDITLSCFNVDKLRQFPKYTTPTITPEVLQVGGQLKLGVYEFYVAYCDKVGREITEYFTPTHPIRIFDENNQILLQPDLESKTNYAIKLKVDNLDTNFKYYKVVVVQKTSLNQALSAYFIEGIHPTTEDTITYASDANKERIASDKLYTITKHYERAKGIMTSNNTAFQWGLVERREVNLQPIVNLLGSTVKWSSSVAKEDLFKSPIATSKYQGYTRDEVQPFAIRFKYKDGGTTATYPLIPRPPKESELEEVDQEDLNRRSIEENVPNCTESTRTKKWQLFNTATVEKSCVDIEDGAEVILEDIQNSCVIDAVATVPLGALTIDIDGEFTDLATYINENYEDVTDPLSSKYLATIAPYLVDTYPAEHCQPIFGNLISDSVLVVGKSYVIYELQPGDIFTNVGYISEGVPFIATGTTPTTWTNSTDVYITDCGASTLTSFRNIIGEVVDEVATKIEKTEAEYTKSKLTKFCSIYKTDPSTGAEIRDTSFENDFMACAGIAKETVYFRDSDFYEESCSDAFDLPIPTDNPIGYFHNYYGELVRADLLLPQETAVGDADFDADFIHKGALWYKVEKNSRDKFVFEIGKKTNCPSDTDDISTINKLRYNFYANCSSTTSLGGAIVDMSVGVIDIVDITTFPDTFYVVIDAAITSEIVQTEPCNTVFSFPAVPTLTTKYRTAPLCGCFSAFQRNIEYKNIEVEYSSIIIDKEEVYTSECKFFIPKVDSCDPIPFAQGDFAYWQSIRTYSDNKELFDSSDIKIESSDLSTIPVAVKNEFLNNYTTLATDIDGNYIWAEEIKEVTSELAPKVDFTCRPIRHYKFPDNNVSPFMTDIKLAKNAQSLVFPLGIHLDSTVVDAFLKIAVKNNLISQKEYDNIESYEILRGDNVGNKSIVGSGLAYDMYKYTENNKIVHYANFPHNGLGTDIFHEEFGSQIGHPYSSTGNNKYSVISPDILYNQLQIPTEITMSGYQLGNATNYFNEVEEHSKWVILGRGAKTTADILSIAEVALETIAKITDFTVNSGVGQSWFMGGLTFGTNAVGAAISAGSIAVFAATTALQGFTRYGKYRLDWLNIFRDLGKPTNFSSYGVSLGYHNYFQKNTDNNNYLRGISTGKNLKDYRRYSFLDEKSKEQITVNSYLREYSSFISLGNYSFQYSNAYKTFDNSDTNIYTTSRATSYLNSSPDKNVGSPYITLKNWVADQYGNIDSVKWLTTNYSNELGVSTDCQTIFGGTAYISRFSWKRKIPFFTQTAFKLADKLPFNYSDYPNVAKARFYVDYETGGEVDLIGALIPDINTEYVLDEQTPTNKFYIKKPSKFYLWYYGISDFLVESEINCFFRYGEREPEDQFYPLQSDVVGWTQEKNVSIGAPNKFLYNNIYSTPVSNTDYTYLDNTYSKIEWEKRAKQDNLVIYSQQDNDENDFADPWLIYKPLDRYEFPTKFGKLIQLKDLESAQVLGRFENTQVLFNAIDNLAQRLLPETKELGAGGIFNQRPIEFKVTDLGYAGTQHSEMVSTPYGHLTVDAKRGQIFMLDQNGRELVAISERSGNEESGMKSWFKEHLPFKILKYLPQIDINNKFKGIGLNIWWDSRYSRVFFTKRDYVLKSGIDKNDFTFTENNQLLYNDVEVFFDNITLFEDVSWTIAYKVTEGRWTSYYSFTPDYSVAHNDFFNVGYNWGVDKEKLWEHNHGNSSYQVFQGRLYPFIIEAPVVNQNVNKILNTISLNIEAKRYQNLWDFSQDKEKGFNKAIIYNNTNNSHLLELIPQKTASQSNRYPITKANSQEILFTPLEGKHTFNYFYNRVRNQDNNIPIWDNDFNRIDKTLNPLALSFKNKPLLEKLRGETFLIRLINDNESRYNILLKNIITTETNYE
jgi:hypothetical protein